MSRSTGRASTGAGRSKNARGFGLLQFLIIGLTVATALIHFVLAFDYTFILNGLGYLTLLGMLYLPIALFERYRRYIRWALMLYAAVTIILWVVISGGGFSTIAYITKAIEIALIVALWLEETQNR